MLEESMALLLPAGEGEDRQAVFVDATFGAGGHTETLLLRSRGSRVIALDADPAAVTRAQQLAGRYPGRVDAVHANYGRLDEVLDERGVREVDGIMYDLGLSSLQLADSTRGFSFAGVEPLDMRLDPTSNGPTAAHILNTAHERELADLIESYGDERFARRIARQISWRREKAPLQTTSDLVAAVLSAQPKGMARTRRGIHPATRTFQALRMAVNEETQNLERSLETALSRVRTGGRVVAISFHSGEDRVVKRAFRAWTASGKSEALTRKPLTPGDDEVAANPRARSAKLRAVRIATTKQEATT
jgi:16S rRNA (cytosine1402-N4)-methyltransferase